MADPVIDPEGNTFERAAITAWLLSNPTSPITRKPLSVNQLSPNRALLESIQEFVLKNSVSNAVIPQVTNSDTTLKVSITSFDGYAHISINPPTGNSKTPSNICCIVDISGSMSAEVSFKNEFGQSESNGLSQLDLVKHALRTIIYSLSSNDRLSVVVFSSYSRVVFDLTFMDQNGKVKALALLDGLQPTDSTNIWDGLQTGLNIINKSSLETKRNSAIFLLTDGQPNMEPPRGHIPTLKKFIESNRLGCTINTFGFGYNLDTKLLEDIATEGNGSYSFIPDGAFVGTIFVNAISNVLSTVATNVTLELDNMIASSYVNEFINCYSHRKTENGIILNMGNISFDQSRNIVVPILMPSNSDLPYLTAKLTYTSPYALNINEINELGVNKTTNLNDISNIELHKYRLLAIEKIRFACNQIQNGNILNAQKLIYSFIGELNESIALKSNIPEYDYYVKYLSDLAKDMSGQVAEAFSKQEYYSKWGRHYLPSLMKAHSMQFCNNFKDPGVQHYGGKLFNVIRDEMDEIFCKLPAPKPSIIKQNYVPAPVSMSSYYDSSSLCFIGSCNVLMADGTTKLVKEITKGDLVMTTIGHVSVTYVVKTLCTNSRSDLVTFNDGLVITPWHPVNVNGKWTFPKDLGQVVNLHCDELYSFALDKHHIMLINNVECICLGHNFTGPVIEHEYFGTDKIINDLKELDDGTGLIEITAKYILSDPITGMINKLKKPSN
jgi:hypothetical protein